MKRLVPGYDPATAPFGKSGVKPAILRFLAHGSLVKTEEGEFFCSNVAESSAPSFSLWASRFLFSQEGKSDVGYPPMWLSTLSLMFGVIGGVGGAVRVGASGFWAVWDQSLVELRKGRLTRPNSILT